MQLFLSATEARQLRALCLPNFCTKWFSTTFEQHSCPVLYFKFQGTSRWRDLMHWYCFYKACKPKEDLPHFSSVCATKLLIDLSGSIIYVLLFRCEALLLMCVVVPLTLLVWDISHNEFVSQKSASLCFLGEEGRACSSLLTDLLCKQAL